MKWEGLFLFWNVSPHHDVVDYRHPEILWMRDGCERLALLRSSPPLLWKESSLGVSLREELQQQLRMPRKQQSSHFLGEVESVNHKNAIKKAKKKEIGRVRRIPLPPADSFQPYVFHLQSWQRLSHRRRRSRRSPAAHVLDVWTCAVQSHMRLKWQLKMGSDEVRCAPHGAAPTAAVVITL